MVIRQGDIIKFNFNPKKGHEQAGYRPAVVISNETFNTNTDLLIVLPVAGSNNEFPLHVPLDDRTTTDGYIMCEHPKSIDRIARDVSKVESLPRDILKKIIGITKAEISIE